jgi:hypothetical protein
MGLLLACLAFLGLAWDGMLRLDGEHTHTHTRSLFVLFISLLRCDTSLYIRRFSLSWFIWSAFVFPSSSIYTEGI